MRKVLLPPVPEIAPFANECVSSDVTEYYYCDKPEKPRNFPGLFVLQGEILLLIDYAIAGVTPISGTLAVGAGTCLSATCACERVRRWTK